MSVQVYGCNHLAIEVDDVKAAVNFYEDVFNLKKLKSGEGDAFLARASHLGKAYAEKGLVVHSSGPWAPYSFC